MNPLEAELIQIPKSHFQSINTRLLGIKNLIRIYVAKENELKVLKRKYQKMEDKHGDVVQEFISEKIRGLSVCDSTQTESYHSLPIQNSCSKTKQVGISEETYFDILGQLCHAKSVLRNLQKTSDRPLKIESWTQTDETSSPATPTDETSSPATPTDTVTELTQNYQALQKRMEKQQLELESLNKKNANLTKQLGQELSAKKTALENEKKSLAKLKREQELHQQTKQKLQDIKAKVEIPKLNRCYVGTCSSEVFTAPPQCGLEVDCGEEDIPSPKKCKGCQQFFSTDEDFEYHNSICQKLKPSSNK